VNRKAINGAYRLNRAAFSAKEGFESVDIKAASLAKVIGHLRYRFSYQLDEWKPRMH
jgi:hypothetical protein